MDGTLVVQVRFCDCHLIFVLASGFRECKHHAEGENFAVYAVASGAKFQGPQSFCRELGLVMD